VCGSGISPEETETEKEKERKRKRKKERKEKKWRVSNNRIAWDFNLVIEI